MAMDKNQKHPSASQWAPVTDNSSTREQQAREIMQQLVTEGIFSPDEAAEVTFSDTAFICIPDKEQKPADKKGVK
ncbi:MAG: hypothetical protein ACK5LF_23225 [Bacteroides xylanisolvens]